MSTRSRWTINPKKWFGVKSRTKQQQEPSITPSIRAPFTATSSTRTVPTTSTFSQLISGKNKMNVTPMPISNGVQENNSTVIQLQLPAFSSRRERTASTFHRQNTYHPTPTEPTIRKIIRKDGELSVDTTRWNLPRIPISDYGNFERNSSVKQIETSISDMSHRCLINYHRKSGKRIEEFSLPSRSSSLPSIMNDNDRSSSSGVFTDERQRTNSKDTLSILEVLSVDSIPDSQTSINPPQNRPIIHHYRRPMSVIETIDDKPGKRQPSLALSHRSHSAEGILEENSSKSQQPSVVIIKRIDKPSPPRTLEKAGIVRIANDTYRLTTNKIVQPRKNSIDFFVPYSTYDDSLRAANNEESYAALPRATSTEQLNNGNLQNGLRMIVDDCIRPIISSVEKNRLNKTRHHLKRSYGQIPLNIENITDKLLSSMDYSIYTRYQRCN